jgi:hypothetical protein
VTTLSNSGRSSAPGLTSCQAGGHLTPTSYSCDCRLKSSQSHIATDGQSVSKSWCRAPSGTHDQIFSYYYLTVTVLFLWGALSDERTGLSFLHAAGSSQRGLSRVRVPWYSRPYFTVLDLRLSISSPLMIRRVMVEVFDPASTRVNCRLRTCSAYNISARTAQKNRFPLLLSYNCCVPGNMIVCGSVT